MRTAILMPSGCRFSASQPNSMETVVRTLIQASPGHDVRIFCCEGAEDHGLSNIVVLPSEGARRRTALIEGLRAYRPDVIEHHQQVKQAVFVSSILPDPAHILYRHNALKTPRHMLETWRYNRRYEGMDGFVFVSDAEKDAFVRAYPRQADRAFSVPNPIDVGPWLAPLERREPIIAFAGRAMPEKGVAAVCAALPTVLDRHPAWGAVLMLNDWDHHHRWAGPHVAPLARFGERIKILRSAPISQVQEVMKSAAIALTPSIWDEPFGLTAVEAHAAGAALISSGRGGLREASGPHALYLRAVTPSIMVEAMERLILDPGERFRLARGGQRYVSEVHQPGRRAAQLQMVRRIVLAQCQAAAVERAPPSFIHAARSLLP
ncbi:glycosyltransferase family 4 protein [Brevundimonas sp.]|uniref:glycosyltransferase family 4 protein n=1 Tax=Brevundimonas sp. TaxID=1871086 RepID=UPI0025C6F0CE|nr:glycosyltransferase family 4 protein [Brevundimonas sp.]